MGIYFKFILIAGLILITGSTGLFGYKTYVSSNEFEPAVLGEVVDMPVETQTPVPTESPEPSPASKPVQTSPQPKLSVSQPSLAPAITPVSVQAPTSSRVPVYLPHNGSTKMCESSATSAVTNASNVLLQKQNEVNQCGSNLVADAQSCADHCMSEKDKGRNICFQNAAEGLWPPEKLIACQSEVSNFALICIDSCKASIGGCASIDPIYASSLNSLLSQYCN